MTQDFSDMWKWDLRQGNSPDPSNGACVMDAVSWFHYGTLGDHPECACPVITEFAIRVNDALPDDERQKLKPFIFRMIGNRDPASEQERAEYLAWQSIRVFAPFALDAAGLTHEAEKLRRFEGSLEDAAGAARTATYTAARAAAYAAAYAAYTAARAAYAARTAARAARTAARAAAYVAADAAHKKPVWHAMIDTLDGVLRIGKQADEYTEVQVADAVSRFERAREAAQ